MPLPPAALADEAEDSHTHPPLLVAAVPPSLMHRLAWLRGALADALADADADADEPPPQLPEGDDDGGEGAALPRAAACHAALVSALDSEAGRAWVAAAGEPPPALARRMAAARFAF